MKRLVYVVAAAALLAGVTTIGFTPAQAELAGACLKDAKAMCPGVTPGGGKIRDCLKTHIKDLSDECKDILVKAVNVKACTDDVKQHCAGMEAGGGKIEACLKANIAHLSDACKVALANAAAGDD